ncbi:MULTISPECIES: ABC transporter ATP-binding protein [Bordetella]|uniref:ABC transporter ATP-binding protein n=2 Tax=Bordetella TaxID=517 RepID=A0A261VIV0_9BORD|nr:MULTISPECIES: ABC transporter ATP-binding protein [Bordetella]MDM9559541.1 ABC transporter ATP-binding protein [Bordetella petrii]OZI73530.1 ABC transporter ATP-binding protein [Bordetella genomosp. 2]
MPEAMLAARGITRRFGGLVAVDNVSLELHRGTVHAVIGTNGAGKSTLINILSGELAASAGEVLFEGRDITAWPQPQRARGGLGRSYQRSTIFPALSVYENCRLAAQAGRQQFWRWWRRAADCPHSAERARHALERTGLAGSAALPAGLLPHGHKRQLEIAMCLAGHPRVLLLDEPLAGMGPEETERILGLLQDLKTEHAILLVEHDMDAVFGNADIITVMVNGAAIACGTPAQIRANAEVQNAYLGDDACTH